VPVEPARQPVDAEQLLRTILRELEQSAGEGHARSRQRWFSGYANFLAGNRSIIIP
jgi:hypothetical protein